MCDLNGDTMVDYEKRKQYFIDHFFEELADYLQICHDLSGMPSFAGVHKMIDFNDRVRDFAYGEPKQLKLSAGIYRRLRDRYPMCADLLERIHYTHTQIDHMDTEVFMLSQLEAQALLLQYQKTIVNSKVSDDGDSAAGLMLDILGL